MRAFSMRARLVCNRYCPNPLGIVFAEEGQGLLSVTGQTGKGCSFLQDAASIACWPVQTRKVVQSRGICTIYQI